MEKIRNSPDKPKSLIMINHERFGTILTAKPAPKQAQTPLDGVTRPETWWNHERSPRHLQHLPRDY
jgi:hypothetical protein